MKNAINLHLIVLLLLFPFLSFGQKENNIWAFGGGLGLDFNSPSPTVISTNIFSYEGCASICDEKGNLLFYTNGLKVWDSTHNVMPNGTGLLGASSYSATQGVAIAPVLGHPTKYFIFTLEDFNGYKSGYLRYSVVDMSKNFGKGDILIGIKNNLLDTGMSEKMIIAPACDGLWLITHSIDSPTFYSYKIDNPLVVGRPVISKNPGLIYSGNYYVGEMKLSPNQKFIALCNWISPVLGYKGSSNIELFDFDKKTGLVSNPKVIDSSAVAYSVEFSPDNSKLYVCEFDSSLFQYNISLLPSLPLIYASKYKFNGKDFTSMRLGPDGKIYVNRHNYFTEISRINDPNKSGLAANLEVNVSSLINTCKSPYVIFGNSTIIPYPGGDTTITSKFDTTICKGDLFTYFGDKKFKDFVWHDGKTESNRTFDSQGVYYVSFTRGCTFYIDTIVINLKEKKYFENSLDASFCFRKEHIVTPTKPALKYLWDNGSESATDTFRYSGKKWISSTNNDCVFNIDTFNVVLTNFEINIKDTFICEGEEIKFDIQLDTIASYLWQNGSTESFQVTKTPGVYWAYVTVGNCSKKQEAIIFRKSFAVNFNGDTTICQGDQVQLEVLEKDVRIKWQDGSESNTFLAKQKGTYSVTLTRNECTITNSVYVNEVICEDCLRIPNAFTPNGDYLNDRFRILTACIVDHFSIMIYSRFGEQVFYSENINEAWDGTFKGQLLNTGTFYYLIRIRFKKPDALEELYKGDVSILR